MIKISIKKDGRAEISLEVPANEFNGVVEQIPQILEHINSMDKEDSPEIPFEKPVKVKEVKAAPGVVLTEAELDEIQKLKKEGEARETEAAKELIDAETERLEALAEENRKREAAEKAAKAKAEEEKLNADIEAEERANRKKARRKRALMREVSLEDGPLSAEELAEKEADEAEEEADIEAETAYLEKYSNVKPEAKAPEVKKPETKAPAEKPTETETEQEVTAPAQEQEEKSAIDKAIEKCTEIWENQAKNNSSLENAINKSKAAYTAAGLTPVEATVYCMTEHKNKKKIWDMMLRQPEVLAKKFGLSKEEAAQVIKEMA